ncbi:nitrous oxide reductase accessory protein NosL [Shewanella sp. AS16]|uniref:nitrous oxide reductase accessory protein NosL n=1 Tax=Shewanella sp. AS16 TaxID=2907625 RepID=UPI001F32AC5E|nr:nitrous oxide reductase accessory protein NosL [Shewanella sp. AS16]MCE9687579.1 nitrous oxide reductase accessory protein NosL [Shewanella sp. AS16]
MKKLYPLKLLLLTLLTMQLFACGEQSADSQPNQAVALARADECHLCGMLIGTFPGPKGELYTKTSDTVKKFCSTRDLFTFLLDPEYRHQVKEIYVHDMSKSPWEAPLDSHFIDARSAWYVIGSSKTGAMGKTLASFGDEASAQAFAKAYGGTLYRFEQITLALL